MTNQKKIDELKARRVVARARAVALVAWAVALAAWAWGESVALALVAWAVALTALALSARAWEAAWRAAEAAKKLDELMAVEKAALAKAWAARAAEAKELK